MSDQPLQVGDLAPDFITTTETGEQLSLASLRGHRVVLYFYPKDDTSGCTAQACGFRDQYLDIAERNAVVLGVSPDSAASHQKFKTKYNLPFTLLVDADHAIATAYGVWQERAMYGKKYMGIVRSHFIIDAEGRIADIQFKVSPADSVTRALASLAE